MKGEARPFWPGLSFQVFFSWKWSYTARAAALGSSTSSWSSSASEMALTLLKCFSSAMTSRLDGIPGIGDVRKKALLKHFKSVKAISEAELLQLEVLLPKAAARAVYDHFHEKNT